MKPATKQRRYKRKWRKTHRDKGLCIDCNKKAVPGRARCAKHLRKVAARTAKSKARKRVEGICIDCDKKALPGQRMCAKHSMDHNRRRAKFYHVHRLEMLEKERKRKQKRKDNGRCVACGALLDPDDNCVTCVNCRCGIQRPRGIP